MTLVLYVPQRRSSAKCSILSRDFEQKSTSGLALPMIVNIFHQVILKLLISMGIEM